MGRKDHGAKAEELPPPAPAAETDPLPPEEAPIVEPTPAPAAEAVESRAPGFYIAKGQALILMRGHCGEGTKVDPSEVDSTDRLIAAGYLVEVH